MGYFTQNKSNFNPLTIIFQFGYNVSIPQWNFLRLLSAEGRQMFTYRCVNSIGWEDQQNGNYDKAIQLMGANDEVLTYGSDEITLIEDSCKVLEIKIAVLYFRIKFH